MAMKLRQDTCLPTLAVFTVLFLFTSCGSARTTIPYETAEAHTLATDQLATLDWSLTRPARRGDELVYQIDGKIIDGSDGEFGPNQARLPAGTHVIRFGGPDYVYDINVRLQLDGGHLYQVAFETTGGAGPYYLGGQLLIVDATARRLVWDEPLIFKPE
jgi:hypothetical protein